MSLYFPKPNEPFREDINVKVDLSNYATKNDLKNISHIDVSSYVLKSNLASLKTEADKLDIDKLTSVPIDLAKLSNVVKNDVVNKTEYDKLVNKVSGIDNTNFVSRTKYVPNISGLATSSALTAVENKIPDISSLATTSALTAVENKIPGITGLVKKTDVAAKLKTISDRVTKNKSKHLLVENELKQLEAPDLSYFGGKNYFDSDDGVFQPAYKYFKTFKNTVPILFSPSEFITEWKSKGLNDVIKSPDNSLAPALVSTYKGMYPKFKGSCLKQDKIAFNHGKIVNIYIVYDLESNLNNFDPVLENFLFGAVKLTKNNDIDKCKYTGYGIGFDSKGIFLFSDGSFGQNVIIFGADMSSSIYANNKINNILVLDKQFIQGINDTTIYTEKTYSINFTNTEVKFCLSLHYNGDNSYRFVNVTEICKFKAKDSEIVPYPLCLGNISKDFSVDNMKKTGLHGQVHEFSIDYDAIANDKILDIHKYLMKKYGMI